MSLTGTLRRIRHIQTCLSRALLRLLDGRYSPLCTRLRHAFFHANSKPFRNHMFFHIQHTQTRALYVFCHALPTRPAW